MIICQADIYAMYCLPWLKRTNTTVRLDRVARNIFILISGCMPRFPRPFCSPREGAIVVDTALPQQRRDRSSFVESKLGPNHYVRYVVFPHHHATMSTAFTVSEARSSL
jgi:hypothetical protein